MLFEAYPPGHRCNAAFTFCRASFYDHRDKLKQQGLDEYKGLSGADIEELQKLWRHVDPLVLRYAKILKEVGAIGREGPGWAWTALFGPTVQ